MSDLSYREKTLWLMAGSLLLVFGAYFQQVLPAPGATVLPSHVGRFVIAVAVLVVLQIVGHAIMAAIDRRTEPDERDQAISLRSERNGAFVLASGVFLSLVAAVTTEGNFLFTHLLLAFWVLSTLTSIGTALWLYRRGSA